MLRSFIRDLERRGGGVDGNVIDVEVDVSGEDAGRPLSYGRLPDAAGHESRDRIRSAMNNCGYDIPPTEITDNLSPADTQKKGSGFDLPMALGILGA